MTAGGPTQRDDAESTLMRCPPAGAAAGGGPLLHLLSLHSPDASPRRIPLGPASLQIGQVGDNALECAGRYLQGLLPAPIDSSPVRTARRFLPSTRIGGDAPGCRRLGLAQLAVCAGIAGGRIWLEVVLPPE